MVGYGKLLSNFLLEPVFIGGDAVWAKDFAALRGKNRGEYRTYFQIFNAAGWKKTRPAGVQRL